MSTAVAIRVFFSKTETGKPQLPPMSKSSTAPQHLTSLRDRTKPIYDAVSFIPFFEWDFPQTCTFPPDRIEDYKLDSIATSRDHQWWKMKIYAAIGLVVLWFATNNYSRLVRATRAENPLVWVHWVVCLAIGVVSGSVIVHRTMRSNQLLWSIFIGALLEAAMEGVAEFALTPLGGAIPRGRQMDFSDASEYDTSPLRVVEELGRYEKTKEA
jgi:hypothetical protein